jgi:hypothetical protein
MTDLPYLAVGLCQQLLDLGFGLLCGHVLDLEQAHQSSCGSNAGNQCECGNEYGGEAHFKILGVDDLPLALPQQLCGTSQSVCFTNATLDNSQMDERRPQMKTPARGRGLTLP